MSPDRGDFAPAVSVMSTVPSRAMLLLHRWPLQGRRSKAQQGRLQRRADAEDYELAVWYQKLIYMMMTWPILKPFWLRITEISHEYTPWTKRMGMRRCGMKERPRTNCFG